MEADKWAGCLDGMVVDRIRAFISYASCDGVSFRDDLCAYLGRDVPHIEPWYDDQQPPGYAFRPALEHRIRTSDVMLFVLTGGATVSEWCLWEARLARDREIPLLVLGIHETEPLQDLYPQLRIDFLHRGEGAWSELRKRLNQMASPQALIDSYHKRVEILERRRAVSSVLRRRYDEELEDLRERERLQEARLTAESDDTGQRRWPRSGDDGYEGVVERHDVSDRLSPFAPPPAPATFCDRIRETDQLLEATTDPSPRLLVLSGPGGGGKSAVVSRLAQRLSETGGGRLLYLTAGGYRPVDPTAVLTALAHAAPEPSRSHLLTVHARDEGQSVAERLGQVLRAVECELVVLAIDDAQDVLDTSGEITSTPLRQLVDDIIDRSQRPAVQLLLASTVPPKALLRRHGSERCREVGIGTGLDSVDAWNFLTSLDSDDVLSLKNTSTTERDRLWHLTQGWPRALELVIGLLSSNPDLTLTELMENVERRQTRGVPAPDAVVTDLLGQVVEQLDRTQQRTLQALAVYGRPVPPEAVDRLLDPYVPRISTSALLDRLHRRRLVRRDGPRYYLPRQPDGEHILQLIPEGDIGDGIQRPPPTTQVALFSRAAEFFADVQRHHTGSDDLTAGFAEIELRLQAHEDEKVLDLMEHLTLEHLAPSGNAVALNPWRRRLIDRLGHSYDGVHNLSQIANAHLAVGEPQQALQVLDEARSIADELAVPGDVLALAVQMGDASFDIGDIAGAARHYNGALHDAEDADLPLLRAQARLGLMQCGAETADFAAALAQYDAGMEIIDRYGITDSTSTNTEQAYGLRRTAGLLLLQAALLEATLGRFSPALQAVRRGSRIAQDLKETRLAGAYLVAEAVIRTDLGELDTACALAAQATEVALHLRNPQLAREAGATLARALICTGNMSGAEKAARQAARSFQDPRSMGALTLHGLTLLRTGHLNTAHRAFSRAEAHGRAMINRDWRSYDIQDYQGLAVSGLIRCGDDFRIEDAISAYQAARNTTQEERVIRRSVRLLRQLAVGADTALRERLVAAAAGGLYEAI